MDPAAVRRAGQAALPAAQAARAARLLAVLAEPNRLRALQALSAVGEMCVGDVACALGISDDAASYALRTLSRTDMAAMRRDGRMLLYRLADGFPDSLLSDCVRDLMALRTDLREA